MSTSVFLPLAFMSSIWSLQHQHSFAIRPSSDKIIEHEDDDTAVISPAMMAFFRDKSSGTTPSAAHNSTSVPKWMLPAPELPQRNNGVRTIVLVGGVVCMAVGIGLLVTAAMAYLHHGRRSRPEVRLGAA